MKLIILFLCLSNSLIYADVIQKSDSEFSTEINNDQYPEKAFEKKNVKVIRTKALSIGQISTLIHFMNS